MGGEVIALVVVWLVTVDFLDRVKTPSFSSVSTSRTCTITGVVSSSLSSSECEDFK